MERYFILHSEEDIKNKESLEEALKEVEMSLCLDPVAYHYTIIKGETIPIRNKIIVSPLYEAFNKKPQPEDN